MSSRTNPAERKERYDRHLRSGFVRWRWTSSKHAIGERLWEPSLPSIEYLYKSVVGGGDGGIRTLGTDVSVRRFSKPLVSATHPRLRIAAARARYSEGGWARQGLCRALDKSTGRPGKTLLPPQNGLGSSPVHCRAGTAAALRRRAHPPGLTGPGPAGIFKGLGQ